LGKRKPENYSFCHVEFKSDDP